jgi:hypothetical protein
MYLLCGSGNLFIQLIFLNPVFFLVVSMFKSLPSTEVHTARQSKRRAIKKLVIREEQRSSFGLRCRANLPRMGTFYMEGERDGSSPNSETIRLHRVAKRFVKRSLIWHVLYESLIQKGLLGE